MLCRRGAWCVVRSLAQLSFLAFCWLIGCAAPPVPAAPTLVVQPTVERRAVGLVDEANVLNTITLPENPNLNWQFDIGDGRPLLDAVQNGALDAALVHYIPVSAENLWHNPVALDGLVFVVHPDNPLESLSLSQIQAIYTGQLTNWSELGGPDGRIEPLLRAKGSGVREIFEARVMGSQRVSVNVEIRPNATSLHAAITSNVNAIGLTTYSARSADLRPLAIDNILADSNQLATQQYPLTVPLYWVSLSEPTGELRGILAYLQSDTGQAWLGEYFGRIR